jgi:hypothetical protein
VDFRRGNGQCRRVRPTRVGVSRADIGCGAWQAWQVVELTDIVDSGGLRTLETRVNERELNKNAARRLAIIRHAREVTGNVA